MRLADRASTKFHHFYVRYIFTGCVHDKSRPIIIDEQKPSVCFIIIFHSEFNKSPLGGENSTFSDQILNNSIFPELREYAKLGIAESTNAIYIHRHLARGYASHKSHQVIVLRHNLVRARSRVG